MFMNGFSCQHASESHPHLFINSMPLASLASTEKACTPEFSYAVYSCTKTGVSRNCTQYVLWNWSIGRYGRPHATAGIAGGCTFFHNFILRTNVNRERRFKMESRRHGLLAWGTSAFGVKYEKLSTTEYPFPLTRAACIQQNVHIGGPLMWQAAVDLWFCPIFAVHILSWIVYCTIGCIHAKSEM